MDKPYGYVRADGKGLFIYGDHQFTNNQNHDLIPVYTHPKDKVIQKAWNMMSMHNSELLLENEQLKKQLMRRSLWYAIKRAIRIWRGKE